MARAKRRAISLSLKAFLEYSNKDAGLIIMFGYLGPAECMVKDLSTKTLPGATKSVSERHSDVGTQTKRGQEE